MMLHMWTRKKQVMVHTAQHTQHCCTLHHNAPHCTTLHHTLHNPQSSILNPPFYCSIESVGVILYYSCRPIKGPRSEKIFHIGPDNKKLKQLRIYIFMFDKLMIIIPDAPFIIVIIIYIVGDIK